MIIDSPIISGSVAASGSLNQFGNITITGSLTVTGNITGNITGSATNAVSASYSATATSASYAANATSASYAAAATSASYALSSTSASYSADATSASFAQSAISASNALTASYLSNYIPPFPFTGSAGISGSLVVNGDITAQTLIVQTITSSEDFVTGSTHFGSLVANTHQFTGSVTVSGSLAVNGSSAILTNQTGAMSVATASYVANAVSASYAATATSASYASASTSASYSNTSTSASYASEATSASLAQSAISASYALTASYASNVPATSSFAVSASIALNAVSASYITGSNVIGTVASATSASYALTASYASNVPATSSFAVSASQAQNAVSAAYSAYALTSSYSLAGSGFPFSGSAVITGSLLVTNLSSSGVSYLVADSSGFVTAQTASAALKSTQAFTSTAGQTTFSVTNGYSTGYVDVFINGSKLNDAEFTDTSGTNIVLATGSFVNDVVEVVKYLPASGVSNNVLRQQTIFTASAAQTVFSASYTPGLIDIFYNGSKLNSGDFTANNGTFFTLATASAANDIVDVFVYSYQVGAFSGIGGTGTATQVAYFDTSNSITGSPNFTISGSTMTVTGSLLVSGSGTFTNIGPAVFSGSITSTQGFTGSFSGTATSATSASYAASATSASYAIVATTASYADALTVAGTLTAQTLVVQTITSSVDYVTGSTRFGSLLGNTHVFTGSLLLSGSQTISNGDLTLNGNRSIFLSNNNTAAGAIRFYNSTSGSTKSAIGSYYNVADEGNLEFLTGGTSTRMIISSSGNVGIGTNSPTDILDVQKNQNATTNIYFRNTDNTNANSRMYLNLVAGNASAGIAVLAGGSGTGALYIGGVANGSIYFQPNLGGTVSMTITGSNVGIGTTNPITSYGFSRSLVISNPTNSEISLEATTSGKVLSMGVTNGLNYFQTTAGNGYDFQIGGTSRFVISSTGAINTSSTLSVGGNASMARFSANCAFSSYTGDGLFNAASLYCSISTPGASDRIRFGYNDYGSGQYWGRIGFAAPTNWSLGIIGGVGNDFSIGVGYQGSQLYIYANGNYAFSGSNVSDRRKKTNINYITTNQLDNILKLRPVTFNKIADEVVSENIHTGFIAQDIMEEGLPNLVMGSDEGGYGLDYNGILALTVKALQEANAKITSLEEKLERNNII
jgi:hypothetical protein